MYTALYRSERPEVFSEILGQEHIVKILKNQIATGTVSHAYLFCGTRGTGKTTTIVGKVKYLLKSGQYMPSDILVLSFTNASATEMSERINAESGYPIEASTFHKLGLNIIKEAEGKVPKISSLQMRKFVKENVEKLMKNHSLKQLMQ